MHRSSQVIKNNPYHLSIPLVTRVLQYLRPSGAVRSFVQYGNITRAHTLQHQTNEIGTKLTEAPPALQESLHEGWQS